MILRCLIIDDEPVARKIISEFVGRIPYLACVGEAGDAHSAQELILAHPVDLIFLDIEMPGMTGMQFLKKTDNTFLTIITTAYPNYAVQGFELNILDYLLKPVPYERFALACGRALEYLELKHGAHPEEFFFVRTEGRIEKVAFNELEYAESMGNYVILHLTSGRHIIYMTMKGLLEQLPADRFLQVHKSFAINTAKVKSIEGNEIRLGHASVPMGMKMRDQVMQVILKGRMVRRS
ncbi:MAG: response regulator transcription factor [Bacteroidetes bacterium]|nr:response regulator transcription factor [Bacteroidota bacterium]